MGKRIFRQKTDLGVGVTASCASVAERRRRDTMTGRVIIVTGANSGLGYELARSLCEGGNDVVLACRNEERGNRAVEKIKRQNPNALATFMKVTSPRPVRAAAAAAPLRGAVALRF